jgi:hypothetical protein
MTKKDSSLSSVYAAGLCARRLPRLYQWCNYQSTMRKATKAFLRVWWLIKGFKFHLNMERGYRLIEDETAAQVGMFHLWVKSNLQPPTIVKVPISTSNSKTW